MIKNLFVVLLKFLINCLDCLIINLFRVVKNIFRVIYILIECKFLILMLEDWE